MMDLGEGCEGLVVPLAPIGKRAKLIWSVRSKEEAPFDDELSLLAEQIDGFEYLLWESNKRGYLSVDGAGGSEAFSGKDVAICGPIALRDLLTMQLKKVGTSSGHLHSEEFAFR